MDNCLLLVIGIVVVVIVFFGAYGHSQSDDAGSVADAVQEKIGNVVNDSIDQVSSSDGSSGSSSADNGKSGSSDDSSDSGSGSSVSDIVSEVTKYNAQDGGGYYKEVSYSDGGFRQYDTKTGELIGSSYDSDQSKLPSME